MPYQGCSPMNWAEMLDKKGVAKEEKQIYEQIEGKLSTLKKIVQGNRDQLVYGAASGCECQRNWSGLKIIYRSEYQGVLRINRQ